MANDLTWLTLISEGLRESWEEFMMLLSTAMNPWFPDWKITYICISRGGIIN